MVLKSSRRTVLAVALIAGLVSAGCSDDDDGGNLEAFCGVVATTDPLPDGFVDLDPTDVPAAIAAFSEARDAERILAANAPIEIRPDVDVLVTYLDDLVVGLETADPTAERPAVYDDLADRTTEVSAASERIAAFVAASCAATTTAP